MEDPPQDRHFQQKLLMESEFEEYESQPNGWVHLYHQMRARSKNEMGSITVARLPVNQARNRYRDVLALDDTRVILKEAENDYINANYVSVDDVEKKYILTQGPLRSTCPHFWQMAWEQNCKGIVMLNRIIEKGMLKCEPYWPATESRSPMQHGDFVITLLSREEKFAFAICHLELKNLKTSEARNLIHFQYTDWPDFGIPETPDVFLTFLQEVRDSGVLSPEPCIVHCSAGIGRSGTFALVDVILARVEKLRETDSIDIQTTLMDMRQHRYGLIQSPDQLKFSYMAIIEGSGSILSQENASLVVPKPLEPVNEDQEEPKKGSPSSEMENHRPPYIRKLKAHTQPSLDDGESSAAKRVRFGHGADDDDDDDDDDDEGNESVSDAVSSSYSDPEDQATPPPLPPRPASLDKDLEHLGRKSLEASKEDRQKPFNIYGDYHDNELSGAQSTPEDGNREESFLGEQSQESKGESKDLRRRKEEQRERFSTQIETMKEKGMQHEERKAMGNWSPYLLVAAFAAVVAFCGVKWYFSW